MSDAVNKSLDDVIKERKKSTGGDKKKTGKNLTARKGTGRKTGRGQQGKNAGDKNKAQRVQRKTFKKPAAAAGRFIRRTRAGGKDGDKPQKRIQQTKDRKKPEGAAPKVEKRRLRVSNLDFNITHKDLMDLFSKFGSLTKNKIEYDDLGRSKGNAIIEYEKEDSANRAIEEYDGATLDGKTLSVEIDKPTPKKVVKSIAKKVISKRDVPAKQGDRRREGGRDRRDDRRGDRRDNRRGGDRKDNRRDNRGGDSRKNDRDRRQGGGNQRRGGDRRNGGDNNNRNKNNNRNRNSNRNRKPNNNKKDLAEKKSE